MTKYGSPLPPPLPPQCQRTVGAYPCDSTTDLLTCDECGDPVCEEHYDFGDDMCIDCADDADAPGEPHVALWGA